MKIQEDKYIWQWSEVSQIVSACHEVFSSLYFLLWMYFCFESRQSSKKHWRQCCRSHLSCRLPQHPPHPCWFVLEPAGGALRVHSYSVGKMAAPVTTVSLNVLNSLWTMPILRWESNKSMGLMVRWSRTFPFSLCSFSKMQLNKSLGVEDFSVSQTIRLMHH